MLFSPNRHEPVAAIAWDAARARATIANIVRDTEARFSPDVWWRTHPNDARDPAPQYMLYFGACGVIWALRYLAARGAAEVRREFGPYIRSLLTPNRVAMGHAKDRAFGSYLMGDTSIHLLSYWSQPTQETASELARLIEATMDDPTRELMWGAPGTQLAALFLYRRTNSTRWAELYSATTRVLWARLEWSKKWHCHYWTQDMYGQRSTYLDAIHGFVATAVPLIQGRHLLSPAEWVSWRECVANTVRGTAEWEGSMVNWRTQLTSVANPKLVQFCHGAPGFVACLADFPDDSLDDLLIAAGETTWQAGPLRKGSNLCHGTGGNGYAFLKLYRRFNDPKWLDRARAFAMHGIAQTEADFAAHGQLRYSLWTGDLGFAIYLWDCIEGTDRFPTLDTFFPD